MSFFKEHNTDEQREKYLSMMRTCGSFSNLFSDAKEPYLHYRISENVFCKYLEAENVSRSDIAIDAKKDKIGIGIKTWRGKVDSYQKVAEFNKNHDKYEGLPPKEMVSCASELYNKRIDFAVRTHDLNSLTYHCLVRETNKIIVYEGSCQKIDIEKIKIVSTKKNNIYFTDGKHNYNFSISKNTLLKDFSYLTKVDETKVDIIEDPYSVLYGLVELPQSVDIPVLPHKREKPPAEYNVEIILPLYSTNNKKGKYVPPSNNLNMRFAKGRKRDIYEVGIHIPSEIYDVASKFFPGKNSFDLRLPNGKILSVKRCQQNGKSLMSNPNKALGHWLIDEILNIDPNIHITYDMLSQYGIDSVKITKRMFSDKTVEYYIDFAEIGAYENFLDSLN